MSLIVLKFGGTSVADTGKLKRVADRILAIRNAGYEVVVVVSAMAGETDRLIELSSQVTEDRQDRDMDLLLSTGELVSVSLLSMALRQKGAKVKSFTGNQIGLMTDSSHTRARIVDIRPERVLSAVNQGCIAVVAGFQGVDSIGDITTLGRGGSDTTAVALAARLGAPCEIYTDVKGIFTADPRMTPDARLIPRISYDEIIELSSYGSKVMQTRSVLLAKKYEVPVWVKPAHMTGDGTLICEMELDYQRPVVGLAHDLNTSIITISEIPKAPHISADVFTMLAQNKIIVDMIIQSGGAKEATSLAFTCPIRYINEATQAASFIAEKYNCRSVSIERNIGRISAVGRGMRGRSGVAYTMFKALYEADIDVELINSSDIRISCIVKKDRLKEGIQALHNQFQL